MTSKQNFMLSVLFVYQVKVEKGGQTVTAVFREDVAIWLLDDDWYSGKKTSFVTEF